MNKVKNYCPKIALIGPFPPPYGGISIHIQRLKDQLEKNGYECLVYETGRHESSHENIIRIKHVRGWLLKYFFFPNENIIHLHNPDWQMRVIMGLMGFMGKKTIISIHGASLDESLKQGNWLRKWVIIFAAKRTSFIIALNQQIQETVLSFGVKPNRVGVIPSFIPPTVKKEDIASIPQNVWHFIANHNPIISANASKLVFYNNEDLYGLDMCIKLCANLKQYYPRIGMVFALPQIGDYDYFEKIKLRIKESEIEDNLVFQTKPCQFYPILMKSNIFVRPTNTDGDSISIREALYFGVPTISSDILNRPIGVILFKNRDVNDFSLKVKNVLDNFAFYKQDINKIIVEDNSVYIMKVYKKLLKHD